MTNAANLLASPVGVFILLVVIGATGYRGEWVWRREIDRERAENKFLRGLVNQLAGVQEKQTDVNERAVSLAEIRAELRQGGGS